MSDLVPQRTTSMAASGAYAGVRPLDRAASEIRHSHGKRCVDLLGATLILVTIAPVVLLMMAALLASQGRPIFIGHQRVGRGGKPFRCFKFRSMVTDADVVLQRHLETDSEARAEWASSRKLKVDPRITPLGHLIRRTSIDELPQLLNVVRGEMSLVGPRPIVEAEIAFYGRHFPSYCTVRPGLTGLWQVSGRNNISYSERVRLDMAYIDGLGLAQDLLIMAKTVPTVLTARGSY